MRRMKPTNKRWKQSNPTLISIVKNEIITAIVDTNVTIIYYSIYLITVTSVIYVLVRFYLHLIYVYIYVYVCIYIYVYRKRGV